MNNLNSGVIVVTPEIKNLLIPVPKKEKIYPWYETPVDGEFIRPLRLTNSKVVYPPKGVRNAGIVYDITKVTFNGEDYALYRRVK